MNKYQIERFKNLRHPTGKSPLTNLSHGQATRYDASVDARHHELEICS